jgi:hypothetical protein
LGEEIHQDVEEGRGHWASLGSGHITFPLHFSDFLFVGGRREEKWAKWKEEVQRSGRSDKNI